MRRTIIAVGIVFAGLFVGTIATNVGAQGIGDTSNTGAQVAGGEGGEQVYREICQTCHQAHAEGSVGAGVVPALAKNPKLADADWMVTTVLKGRGGMPAFAEMLTPEQVADVTTFVRSHFNDYKTPVTVDDVKRLAPKSEE